MVYGTQITIVTGAYKTTYNWGASHCTRQETLKLLLNGCVIHQNMVIICFAFDMF